MDTSQETKREKGDDGGGETGRRRQVNWEKTPSVQKSEVSCNARTFKQSNHSSSVKLPFPICSSD